MTSHEPPGATILRLLRLGLHAGFFALLALATTRVLLTRDTPAHGLAALAGATALAAVYAAGELVRRHRARRAATAWLATVTTLWAALLAASTDYSWLAFPLFFLHMHLLRGKHAVLAVAAVTGLVITAQIAHAGTWTTGMVLGPVLGALVAVIITSAYTALYTENEQRRRDSSKTSPAPAPNWPPPNTKPASPPNANASPAKSTTPSPKDSPASSCCCAPPTPPTTPPKPATASTRPAA